MNKILNVALLGYGTVGQGVTEILDGLNDNFRLIRILDRIDKCGQIGSRYVGDVDAICQDGSIDAVVEAMGGDSFARQCILKCLNSGKSVVTSNKEVVANHLEEFLAVARNNNVELMFEASVGGGIPIVKTLIDNCKINKVNRIYGILNGTTNFILTQMSRNGIDFDVALRQAQQNGFAELDPSADVDGTDMARKIAVLSSIAYSAVIDPRSVKTVSMRSVTKDIITDVANKGFVLKYVAESFKQGDRLDIAVMPTLVKLSSPLSRVDEANNGVAFCADANGKLFFYGQGAGKMPTASAIVSDLLCVKQGQKHEVQLNCEIDRSNCKAFENAKYYFYRNGAGEFVDGCLEYEGFFARILEE